MKIIDLLSSLIPFSSNLQCELGNNLFIELTGFSTFPGLLTLGCSAIYNSASKENHLKHRLHHKSQLQYTLGGFLFSLKEMLAPKEILLHFNFPNERITDVSNSFYKTKQNNNKSTHLFEKYLLVSDSGGESHANLHPVQLFIISSKTKEPLVKARSKSLPSTPEERTELSPESRSLITRHQLRAAYCFSARVTSNTFYRSTAMHS